MSSAAPIFPCGATPLDLDVLLEDSDLALIQDDDTLEYLTDG